MAVQRVVYPEKHIEPGIIKLSGVFTFAGAANPTENDGKHTTVTYLGVAGKFRIQIAGSGSCDIRDVNLTLQKSGGSSLVVGLEDVDETNRRVDIYVFDAGAALALANPDNTHKLRWSCEVKNSAGQ